MGKTCEKLKSYPLSRDVETNEITGYRYVHYGDIHKQVADIVTEDEQLPCIKAGDYEPLEQGDLVLADASEDYKGIAEPCVILHAPKDKIIAGLHTIALRPQNTAPLYLYYLLHTDKFKMFGGQVGTGLKVFGITFNNLSLFETNIPPLPEQINIGNFFHTLDNLITLHKRKLDSLKQLKMGYLQNMFPQAGEHTPRIHFSGYKGDWGEKKLGKCLKEPTYAKVENPQGIELLTVKLHGNGIVPAGKFPNSAENGRPYYKRNFGEILIGRQNFHNGGIGIVGKNADGLIASNAISSFVLLPNTDLHFIFQYISRPIFQKRAEYLTGGTGQKEISVSTLKELNLYVPTINEQIAIGNFFHTLDEQITTQKTKLDKLKQLKTAYLQKMFI